MDIVDEFRAVVTALNTAKVPYAVCGGFAVFIHGFPRHTQDIDLLIRDEDLSHAKEILASLGFTIDSGSFTFHQGKPNESRFHRVVKVVGEDFLMLDLLAVTPARVAVFNEREARLAGTLPVTVISRAGLRTMKLDAGRPKDLEDLRKLELMDD